MIPEFLAGIDEHIGVLEGLSARQDWQGLYTWAHQLKGALGNYGFHQLTPAAQRLLHAVRAQEPAGEINAAVRALVQLCRRLRPGAAPASPAQRRSQANGTAT